MLTLPFLPVGPDHQFLGRQVIYTSRRKEQIGVNTIPDILNGAMQRHLQNAAESIYLKNYFRGKHPILDREKTVRPDVNNKLVINNAISIVRNGTGYFLGEPIQYTAKEEPDSDNVKLLNSYMDSEDKSAEDMSIGESGAICGRGFRLVAVDDKEEADEAPFEIPSLPAECTEVIYSTRAGHEPLLAFTHAPLLDDSGNVSGTEYTVYDGAFQYVYSVPGSLGTQIQGKHLTGIPKPHFLGAVPIVEYPNNEWRLGDIEIVITLLDAIDKLGSDRLNDVEQIVNAILVFQGLHLRTEKETGDGTSDYDKLKDTMTLEVPNADGKDAKVYYVSSNLDQSQAETLQQTLMDYVYTITGIPDRKQKGGGTGDTGDAVYLRDGFQSLEVVARVKERNFRKAERQTLKMVCEILRRFENISLHPMDVDIKFIRNRTNNLVNKSQAASNLQSTELFAPEDIIQLIGVTDDPKQMAERGQNYKDEQAKKAADQAEKAAEQAKNAAVQVAKAQPVPAVKTLGKGDNPDDTTDGEE